MLEKEIEKKYRNNIQKQKGLFLKFVSPGAAGVPDRIVLLPGGIIKFVELKRPGEKPRPLQKYWHGKLKKLGFTVEVCDSGEGL